MQAFYSDYLDNLNDAKRSAGHLEYDLFLALKCARAEGLDTATAELERCLPAAKIIVEILTALEARP